MKPKRKISKRKGNAAHNDDIRIIVLALFWAALISMAIANANDPVIHKADSSPAQGAQAAKFL